MDVEDAVCRMVSSQPGIVSLGPNDLAGAEAPDAPERGARLVASLIAPVESTARRIAFRARVASIEWIEPLMSGGNWMPELVAMGGGASLFGQAGKHSPWLDWDDLRAADPDVGLRLALRLRYPTYPGRDATPREAAGTSSAPYARAA